MQFDPSLLQPVVRSKRTPVACTECRRRQVKVDRLLASLWRHSLLSFLSAQCSGAHPTCERCEKKGLNCEYMPIYMQKAAAAGAATTGSRRNPGSTNARSTSGEMAQSRVPVYAPYPSQPRYVPSSSTGQSGWPDPAASLNSVPFHETYNASIPVHEQAPPLKEGMAYRLTYQKSDTFYVPVGDVSMASTPYEHSVNQPQFERVNHIAHGTLGSVSSLGLYCHSRTPTPTAM